jgi:hypothetical protein
MRGRPKRRWGWWGVLVVMPTGCYVSFHDLAEGADVRMRDDAGGEFDGPEDGAGGDEGGWGGEAALEGVDGSGPEDAGEDVADSAARSYLEPESGLESFFGPESGLGVAWGGGGDVLAAFSGRVYGILLQEALVRAGADGHAAIYRLPVDHGHLETVWIDEALNASREFSICWSGEAFVAALPTDGVGIRLFGVDEAGHLIRDPLLLPNHPDPDGGGVVLCPSSGPLVLVPSAAGDTFRIHGIAVDGFPEGTFSDVSLPPFDNPPWRCKEAGGEVACLIRERVGVLELPRIAFLTREGAVRLSPLLSDSLDVDCAAGCDLVYLGDAIGLVWAAEEGSRRVLAFARTDLEGNAAAGPIVTTREVDRRYAGIRAATSGDTVLVAAWDPGEAGTASAHLLATDGTLLGDAVRVSAVCPYADPDPDLGCVTGAPGLWTGPAVFWEGDAYAAIWTAGPEPHVGAYRRFVVRP